MQRVVVTQTVKISLVPVYLIIPHQWRAWAWSSWLTVLGKLVIFPLYVVKRPFPKPYLYHQVQGSKTSTGPSCRNRRFCPFVALWVFWLRWCDVIRRTVWLFRLRDAFPLSMACFHDGLRLSWLFGVSGGRGCLTGIQAFLSALTFGRG